MGKRGPKPKPKALRVFEGDPGNLLASRHEGEVSPAAEIAPAPEWLREHGKRIWNETAPRLGAVGLLTTLDGGSLSLYCDAWDDFFEAMEDIKNHGAKCFSEKGGEYQNPSVGIKNKAKLFIKQMGAEFGLSPVSRVGLNTDAGAAVDDLEAFKRSG